jgi:hypothetical protein
VATVLVGESVEFDLDTLDSYVRATYPDLRKCLNTVQMHSVDGHLSAPGVDTGSSQDWKLAAVDLFKSGRINEARKLMCQSVRPEEMEDMFRWMYDNVALWSKNAEQQDRAIIIIRNGLVNTSFVADQEINLSATLCELCQVQ